MGHTAVAPRATALPRWVRPITELHLGHSSAGVLDPKNSGSFQSNQLPVFPPPADVQQLVNFVVWHRNCVAMPVAAAAVEVEGQSQLIFALYQRQHPNKPRHGAADVATMPLCLWCLLPVRILKWIAVFKNVLIQAVCSSRLVISLFTVVHIASPRSSK